MKPPILPNLPTVNHYHNYGYKRYLPSAFDNSMDIYEQMVTLIEHVNSLGLLSEAIRKQWEIILKWIIEDGLNDAVREKLDEMLKDGQLQEILYNILNNVYQYGYDVTMAGVKPENTSEVNTENMKKLNAKEGLNIYFFPPNEKPYKMTVAPSRRSFGWNANCQINEIDFWLGATPEQVNSVEQVAQRLNNTIIGVNAGRHLNDNTTEGYGNVAVGSMAMNKATGQKRNTAVGCDALQNLEDGYSATAIGVGALQNSFYNDRGTFVGGNAGKWLGAKEMTGHVYYTRDAETTIEDKLWKDWRTFAGDCCEWKFVPKSREDTTSNVAVGRNALGYGITTKRSVAIGYNALERALNSDGVVAIGENALQFGINVNRGVFIGQRTGWDVMESDQDVAIGVRAMGNVVHSLQNVAIGYQALANLNELYDSKVDSNIAIGRISMASFRGAPANNVAVGENTLTRVEGKENTALGNSAGSSIKGDYNTFLGGNAGNAITEGTRITALGYNALNGVSNSGFENITGVGQNSSVTGSDQLQLGNSTTTPYAFHELQQRSDRRDKFDIDDLPLHLEFIKRLKAKKYKMYPRESQRDGEPMGKREHFGFIAQDVGELLKELGFDFSGYQDHSVKGGSDVMSLGYTQFIPIMWTALQYLLEKDGK